MASNGSPGGGDSAPPASAQRPAPPQPNIDTNPVFKSLTPPKLERSEPYHLKEGVKAPPRPNEKEIVFPPQEEAHPKPKPTTLTGELKLTRIQPEGVQEIVGAVSATFNQPMVPLTSLADLKDKPVPLQIEPLPPGKVRWLGTSTVEFEPEGRMPFSTHYTVRIPKGVKSELGPELKQERTWTFDTPRVKVSFQSPGAGNNEVDPNALMHLSFNQAVSPTHVAEAVFCTSGGKRFTMRLDKADKDPFENDHGLDVAVRKKLYEERNVYLRSVNPLPLDSQVTCVLPKGFVGAEGPLPTQADQAVVFHTYAPLQVQNIVCGDGSHCDPSNGIYVQLNNSLDSEADQSSHIHISPEVPNLAVTPSGRMIYIYGTFTAKTTYQVRIDTALVDIHKQHLDKDAEGKVTLGETEPFLELTGTPLGLLERDGPRVIGLNTNNIRKAQLRFFKLKPEQVWKAVQDVQQWREDNIDPFGSFTAKIDRQVALGERDSEMKERGLDVNEVLGKDGAGLLLVDLSSPELRRFNRYQSIHRAMVVQVTDLGLTVHMSLDRAIVLVTSLKTGRPVEGAKVKLFERTGKSITQGTTDAKGTVVLTGIPVKAKEDAYPFQLSGEKDDDATVLSLDHALVGETLSNYAYGGGGYTHTPTVVANLFTDRSPYRPGDMVHIAGTIRMMTHGTQGTVLPLPPGTRLKWQVIDVRGQKVKEGNDPVGSLGVFAVDVPLKSDETLGYHYFSGTLEKADKLNGQVVNANFSVEEYRTPEYKVSIDTGEPLHFVKDALHGKVVGEYFFGGAMSGAQASWSVRRSKGYFTPPDPDSSHSGYTFGDTAAMTPFSDWGYGEWEGYRRPRPPRPGATDDNNVASGSGALDAHGFLPIDFSLDPGELTGPISFSIEGSVVDANLQSIHASTTVLAHAGRNYAGLKLDRTVAKEGETVQASAVVVDIDGKTQNSQPKVELLSRHWERVKDKTSGEYHYEEKEEKVSDCELNGATPNKPSLCAVKLPKAGDYVLQATATDAQGRTNRTSVRVYAYGKGFSPWYRNNQSLTVDLVPDQTSYEPGQTAKVLVKSPFPHSVGLLAIEREGLIEWRPLDFEGSAYGVEIPLTEAEAPNVSLSVSLVRGRISPDEAGATPEDPDDRGRPMFAGGQLSLTISLASHHLSVSVSPSKPAVSPGEAADVHIKSIDASGKGVPSRVILAVVDEGVLSLLGYNIPDPLNQMFIYRSAEGGGSANLPYVLQRQKNLKKLAQRQPQPQQPPPGAANHAQLVTRLESQKAMRGEAMEKERAMAATKSGVLGGYLARDKDADGIPDANDVAGEPAPRMTARTLFATTAYFNADLHTNANGELDLKVPMPENLTRFRLTAVAIAEGERFGESTASIQVRKPLLVRPALPRFLNLGDTFLASAVINNQTEQDLWVDAQVRAVNSSVDDKRQRVLIRAGEAQEVSFEARAGSPGTSRWQFAAVALDSQRHNDAAELEVPVELPATTEAFATYGATDKSVLQPVELPTDALPDFGSLDVSLSSTALTSLSDAVTYLWDYPYECVEQTASRILPFIALKEVIGAFHLRGSGTAAERDKLIKTGIERILSKQRDDGGFGYWADSHDSYLYVSAWAGYVLMRAQKAGYPIDQTHFDQLKYFLQNRLNYPLHQFGEDTDFDSQAMATLVLGMMKAPANNHIQRIFNERHKMYLDGKAWLMEAAHTALGSGSDVETELNRELQSAVVEKASSAHFATSKSESIRLLMHSDERTDGIVLAALVHVRPNDPIIPKVVHGLNESQRHGRWDTTQSNAWVTVALGDYFQAYEKVVPNFKTELFVGDAFAGEATFKGRSTTTLNESIPLAAVAKQSSHDLLLAKEGAGRMYYRLGMRYAPKNLKLPPEEQGFSVTRTYEAMPDAPGTVTTDADGTVHIKPGADVRITLQVVVSDRAEFVAIDDPLPAGLEATNTSFLTNQSQRLLEAESTETDYGNRWSEGRFSWWWWFNPFNHTEMHDDRVLLFADQLPASVYSHTYVARATTRGTFQVPPTKALEMYEPENFGRTASNVVIVQ